MSLRSLLLRSVCLVIFALVGIWMRNLERYPWSVMRVSRLMHELSYLLEPKVYVSVTIRKFVSNCVPNATSIIQMAFVHKRTVCAMSDFPTTDRSTTENFPVFVLGVGMYDVVARRYDTNARCTVLSNVSCLDSLYTAMPSLRVEGVLWLIWL